VYANNSKLKLWDSLTESEKKEIFDAFEESKDEKNLIDFETIKKKYSLHAESLSGDSANTKDPFWRE
jgi:hypothetical protein